MEAGHGMSLRTPVGFQYCEVRVTSAEALSASCHLNQAATSRLLVGIHSALSTMPGMKKSLALSSARASLLELSVGIIPGAGGVERVSEKVTKSTGPMPHTKPAPKER